MKRSPIARRTPLKRAAPKKKPRKPKRSTLKAKADQLFRDLIRSRGYCELAGLLEHTCDGALQTCHLVPRRNHRLRWEPLNALCACPAAHRIIDSHEYLKWSLVRKYFPANLAFIEAHANEFWSKDYDEVIQRLKELA